VQNIPRQVTISPEGTPTMREDVTIRHRQNTPKVRHPELDLGFSSAVREPVAAPPAARRTPLVVAPVFRPSRIRPAQVKLSEGPPIPMSGVIDGAEATGIFLREYFEMHLCPVEFLVAIAMNGQQEVTNVSVISQGTDNVTHVNPRDVYQFAILANATKVVVAHNHPSGSSVISDADIVSTGRCVRAGDIIGIEMLDHVIIAGNRTISIRSEHPGLWP
jgi:DNA repair protein RadC